MDFLSNYNLNRSSLCIFINIKMEKENWFNQRKVAGSFAVISVMTGFMFLNKSITGNIVLTEQSPINLISVVGLLLITCSIILGAYSIKRK